MPEYLTITEAADELGVSPNSIRRWIDLGHIEAWKTPGGHRKVSRRALNDFLTDREGRHEQWQAP